MTLQECKIALGPLIRKDGVDVVVWRDADGNFFTITSRPNPVFGQAVEIVLDSEPNKWTQLAAQAFVIAGLPRGEFIWNPHVTNPLPEEAAGRIEFYLQDHRYIVESVPEVGIMLMIVAQRGHPQIKSFQRNITRAAARLRKGA